MRILCFGTYESHRQPRMAVLREGFETHGDEVLECNEPLGVDTSLRVGMLRRPWLLPLLGMRIMARWVRLWSRARRFPPVDAVVVGYMGQLDVHLARRIWRDTLIVLDHMTSLGDTAEDRGVSSPAVLRILRAVDRAALRAADIPMVDTDEHLQMLALPERRRAVVAPIGASDPWFRQPPPPQDDWLRVIFFGLFTPLQGAPVIGEAIRLLHDDDASIRFTMIGHGQDLERTRGAADNAQVKWISWVDAEELPGVVAAHDVCLGIFGTSPKALRVVPHKVVEGAAAGCAILTSDTPPQRRALGSAAVYVPPGDAKELALVLRMLASDPERVRALRMAARGLAEENLSGSVVTAPVRTAIEGQRR